VWVLRVAQKRDVTKIQRHLTVTRRELRFARHAQDKKKRAHLASRGFSVMCVEIFVDEQIPCQAPRQGA